MKHTLFLLLLIYFSPIFCQVDSFYYYKGHKVKIPVNKEMYYVTVSDTSALNEHFSKSAKFGYRDVKSVRKKAAKNGFGKIIQVNSKVANKAAQKEIYTFLSGNPNIKRICPVVGNNEHPVATSEYFYVKIKALQDSVLLTKIAKETACEIIGPADYLPLWYILRVPVASNSINMSNYFYATNLFQDVDPNFMFNFRSSSSCISDPQFAQQWGLQNSNEIDINACEAWNITRGSSSVNVAIVDEGVQKTHPELASNISDLSYDGKTSFPFSKLYGDHGTHVAGIVGAIQNGSQISGVAPKTKIMVISESSDPSETMSLEYASGIGWAFRNGADIINNSWGDQGGNIYIYLQSTLLEQTIDSAMEYGRNGLGCIVVFSAGNNGKYDEIIDYPASYSPEILVVGNCNSNGNRYSTSGYGVQLDVIAPGDNILSTIPTNSTGYKTGTSMAAPHVAGIAALILSLNKNLTRQQVVDIIERTAQKVNSSIYSYSANGDRPNGTWNNQMGYGLVDAYAAVRETVCNYPIENFTYSTNATINCTDVRMSNITINSGVNVTITANNSFTATGTFIAPAGSTLTITK